MITQDHGCDECGGNGKPCSDCRDTGAADPVATRTKRGVSLRPSSPRLDRSGPYAHNEPTRPMVNRGASGSGQRYQGGAFRPLYASWDAEQEMSSVMDAAGFM